MRYTTHAWQLDRVTHIHGALPFARGIPPSNRSRSDGALAEAEHPQHLRHPLGHQLDHRHVHGGPTALDVDVRARDQLEEPVERQGRVERVAERGSEVVLGLGVAIGGVG